MHDSDYAAAGITVRQDLGDCHRFLLGHVTSPGTWWTGAERRAIAEASRRATSCSLCRERKGALSPNSVQGQHDDAGLLQPAVVDVIHRIRTDPQRLSHPWFEKVVPDILADTQYVELVGVVTMTAGMDNFARALGAAPFPFPPASPGEPSRRRPPAAKGGTAWVPMIDVEDAVGPESDMYPKDGFVPNIVRALSLVPGEVRALRRSSDAHYVAVEQIGDPTVRRSIDRMQMELVAARVSALNECFY